jgi:hypothetical protein
MLDSSSSFGVSGDDVVIPEGTYVLHTSHFPSFSLSPAEKAFWRLLPLHTPHKPTRPGYRSFCGLVFLSLVFCIDHLKGVFPCCFRLVFHNFSVLLTSRHFEASSMEDYVWGPNPRFSRPSMRHDARKRPLRRNGEVADVMLALQMNSKCLKKNLLVTLDSAFGRASPPNIAEPDTEVVSGQSTVRTIWQPQSLDDVLDSSNRDFTFLCNIHISTIGIKFDATCNT